jgi:hypothetical protein
VNSDVSKLWKKGRTLKGEDLFGHIYRANHGPVTVTRNRVLTVPHLVNKFFHAIWNFITGFTRDLHTSISWARLIPTAAFWIAKPGTLVGRYRRFGGTIDLRVTNQKTILWNYTAVNVNVSSTQSVTAHPISTIPIVILPSHTNLGLIISGFHPSFPIETLYAFLMSSMRTTSPARITVPQ